MAVEVSPVELDKLGALHEPAEILFVQMPAGDCLDRALQIGERELRRHQLEHDRAVFHLRAQPRDGCCKNSPVVEWHRFAEGRELAALLRGFTSVAPRLLDKARFIQQLVAVERALLVPRKSLASKRLP